MSNQISRGSAAIHGCQYGKAKGMAMRIAEQKSLGTLIRRKPRMLAVVVALMVTLAAGHRLMGQATEFGALNGTVTDQQGKPIVNAQVTAVDVATNVAHTATTNEEGLYRIFSLLPAQYEVTLTAQGFKAVTIAPFKLDVGQTLTQNVTLTVGAVTEQVQVSAQAQLLQTTTALPLVAGRSTIFPLTAGITCR